ncbi:unnamed protein product [Prorocentrum cordatum]|uniref:Uncharacterized protein n=1 Tax=Prorocentrum cordatum TaxID=2364126 RepID=A0ABN9SFH6_9DINO|nr:unnamed protein product [Polarella glacialis]
MQHEAPEALEDPRTGREVRSSRDAGRPPPCKVAVLTALSLAACVALLCGAAVLAKRLLGPSGGVASLRPAPYAAAGRAQGARSPPLPLAEPVEPAPNGTLGVQAGPGAECRGGRAAVCECVLSCAAFGRRREESPREECRGAGGSAREVAEAVQARASREVKDLSQVCSGMACVVRCAQELGCYHDRLRSDCARVQRLSEASGAACTLSCEGPLRAGAPGEEPEEPAAQHDRRRPRRLLAS